MKRVKSTLKVAAVLLVASSGRAFCGEKRSADPCEPKRAEVEKLQQWVTYDRTAKTADLTTNLAKLASATSSLEQCQKATSQTDLMQYAYDYYRKFFVLFQ